MAVWAGAQDAGSQDFATDRCYDLNARCAFTEGDSYRWASNKYERTTLTWGEGEDAEVESDTYLRYGITANSRVNEVDDERGVVAVTHIIERLYLLEEEILPPGTLLVATWVDGETVYTIGDDRIENETLLFVLDRLAGLGGNPGDPVLAALHLPEAPQPVGARWEVDGPALCRGALGMLADVDPALAAGEAHFAGVQDLFGTSGLVLEVGFHLEGTIDAFALARPQWDLQGSTIQIEATALRPQSGTSLASRLEMTARVSQSWYDPAAQRFGRTDRHAEHSRGQRELTEDERARLGFE